jgi:hypothetical protein
MTELHELVGEFDGISLEALEQRAALLRRVDNKYAVPDAALGELIGQVRADHQVLEIDGRREFAYSTTYFDTPELRCFTDHVENRVPRFKARCRLYEDTGKCAFEVKLKRSEDETDKRQIDYSAENRGRLTEAARDCVRSALEGAGLSAPGELARSLVTSFTRVTFAAEDGSERLTCDLGVRLSARGGAVAMRRGLVLVETKSESGESPADRHLARMEFEPISLSKYRVGMSAVGGADRFGSQPGSELFEPLARTAEGFSTPPDG